MWNRFQCYTFPLEFFRACVCEFYFCIFASEQKRWPYTRSPILSLLAFSLFFRLDCLKSNKHAAYLTTFALFEHHRTCVRLVGYHVHGWPHQSQARKTFVEFQVEELRLAAITLPHRSTPFSYADRILCSSLRKVLKISTINENVRLAKVNFRGNDGMVGGSVQCHECKTALCHWL